MENVPGHMEPHCGSVYGPYHRSHASARSQRTATAQAHVQVSTKYFLQGRTVEELSHDVAKGVAPPGSILTSYRRGVQPKFRHLRVVEVLDHRVAAVLDLLRTLSFSSVHIDEIGGGYPNGPERSLVFPSITNLSLPIFGKIASVFRDKFVENAFPHLRTLRIKNTGTPFEFGHLLTIPTNREAFEKTAVERLFIRARSRLNLLQLSAILSTFPHLIVLGTFELPFLIQYRTSPLLVYPSLREVHLTFQAGNAQGMNSMEGLAIFPNLQTVQLHIRSSVTRHRDSILQDNNTWRSTFKSLPPSVASVGLRPWNGESPVDPLKAYPLIVEAIRSACLDRGTKFMVMWDPDDLPLFQDS
ncbi:hypothetical protein HDU93_003031 [Gonapodya sp. JEL0774]|nr:hypothetical protein HDU93_003031 [Gonapodya sp. JEL0774]